MYLPALLFLELVFPKIFSKTKTLLQEKSQNLLLIQLGNSVFEKKFCNLGSLKINE